MNKQLVFTENKTLFLDTSMSLNAFTKSRMADKLAEHGFLAEKIDSGWKFSHWFFTGTKQNKCDDENLSPAVRSARETVLLEGPAFAGRTLKMLFDMSYSKELGETESAFVTYAAARTCSALEEAARQKIDVTNIGAGGIFISADFQKIIFLPKDVFETSVKCAGNQAAAEYNGFFVNPLLKTNAAINFTQSVIAYRTLTGEYPFCEIDSAKHNWDLIDHNYVPLKNKVWALNENLSFFVDNALQRRGTISTYGNKKLEKKKTIAEKISSTIIDSGNESSNRVKQNFVLSFPLEDFYKEIGLTSNGEIPAGGHLFPVIRKSTVAPDVFEKKAAKSNENFQKKLSKKRWFRNHRTALTIAACTIFGIGITVGVFVDGSMKHPTSKSLTSFQTTEMFYSAVNRLDVTAVQGCATNQSGDYFVNMIGNVYVAAKTRSSYNVKETTVAPAEWFCFNYDCNYNIFGITNLKIDGYKGNTFLKGPSKKSKPKTLTSEYGSPLIDGTKKNYVATYDLVYTEDEDDELNVIEKIDEIKLEYKSNRWVIVGFESHEKSSEKFSLEAFLEDYKQANIPDDTKATAHILKDKYSWIPTDEELEAGQVSTDFARNPYAQESE